MSEHKPWLLVVVDGETEANRTHGSGVVYTLVQEMIGEEAAKGAEYIYWKEVGSRLSPRRRMGTSLRGYRAKAEALAKIAEATTAYGAAVMLVDRDHEEEQARGEALGRGVEDAGRAKMCAVGEAVEDIEAWILADAGLLTRALPVPCEQLWGSEADAESNHPKRVLERCVLRDRGWEAHDAVRAWDWGRAQDNAGSLRAFVGELRRLARDVFFVGG